MNKKTKTIVLILFLLLLRMNILKLIYDNQSIEDCIEYAKHNPIPHEKLLLRDKKGRTLLHAAIENNYSIEVIKLLITPRVLVTTNEVGKTPLLMLYGMGVLI